MIETQLLAARFDSIRQAITEELAERAAAIGTAETLDRPEYRNWMPEKIAEQRQKRVAREIEISLNGEARIKSKVSDFLETLRQEKRDRKYPLRALGTLEGRRSSEYFETRAREVVQLLKGNVESFEAEVRDAGELEYRSHLFHYADLTGAFNKTHEDIARYQKLRAAWAEELDLKPLEDLNRRAVGFGEELKRHYYFLPLPKPRDFFEHDRQQTAYEAGLPPKEGGGLIPNLDKA